MRRATLSLAAVMLMSGSVIPNVFAATTSSAATNAVTRGQFLGELMKAVENVTNVKPNADAKQYFSDVPKSNSAFAVVGAAQQAGWLNGSWLHIRVGQSFNVNQPVSLPDIAALFVSSMEAAGRLKLPKGQTPLQYAMNLGIFRGVKLTGASSINQSECSKILANIRRWTQGTLLPAGYVPVVTSSTSNASVNTIIQLEVYIKNAIGRTVNYPSTNEGRIRVPANATVTYYVNDPSGASLIPATGSLMITKPGTYKVTVTVDGVKSAPYTVKVKDQPSEVKLSAAKSVIVANGKQKDLITARVVDSSGRTMTNFNGSATLMPLMHGTFVDPATGAAVTSIRFKNGVGKVDVVAGTTGSVSDTITLTDLTSSTGQPLSPNINYGFTTVNYTWATNEPASVQLSAASTQLSADGQSTDLITAKVLDGYGQVVTSFNGSASLMPMLHGTFIDPASGATITSVTFTKGVAKFEVKAGTTGGVTDTVQLTGLTSLNASVDGYDINYGSVNINYTWAKDQPVGVLLSAARATLPADGSQTDTIKATVVNSYGQTITDFNGTATLSPLTYGTYVDTLTAGQTSTIQFSHGVAEFQVQAGTTGGVTDHVSLSGLTSSDGQAITSNINYGTVSINYSWPSANSTITLTPTFTKVSNNQATQDQIAVSIPSFSDDTLSAATPVATTFTISGPGSFSKTTTQTTVTEYIVPGVSTMLPVWSQAGKSGTIVITASASGMTAGKATITAVSTGAPAALQVTPQTGSVNALGAAQTSTLPVGTPFEIYTVNLTDAQGNPVLPTTDDVVRASDNSGGALEYFAVVGGQPSGSPITEADVATISANSGVAQFAVVNVQAGTANPTISLIDSLGFTSTVPFSYQKGSAAYAMFPLDTTSTVNAATSYVESGQTATYSVQLEDANGNPLQIANQPVDFYFEPNNNLANATIGNSASWSAASPYVAVTNPQGQAFVTVKVPAGATGSFTLEAQLPGGSTPTSETVIVQSPEAYTSKLVLSGVRGGTTSLTWPSADMTVGETLMDYLNQSNSGLTSLYVTPENSMGATSGDSLEITTSNPSVLSISGGGLWTSLNGSSIVWTGNSSYPLPTITAEQPGTATLTIIDLSNPSAPKLTETITVDPS
ncbi:MAG: hypothetical protein K6T83_07085 [Alicyclobacillus sp.]|nr:hypothetical protein [Alicyclobacillus sp.]